jgi:hypothetical protein
LEPETSTEKFVRLYEENIKRDGADKLLEWLCSCDFFTAPASTKFHGNYEGGLCDHSLLVYEKLLDLKNKYKENFDFSEETIAVVALLHDVCKTQFYKKSFRNVKDDDTGKWSKVSCYVIEESVPLGHGEKSVILIQSKMKLTLEEICAIRFHMSSWDASVIGGDKSINKASEMFPLVTLTQIADMEATLFEKRIE